MPSSNNAEAHNGVPPAGFRRHVTSAFGATFAILLVDRFIDVVFLAVLARILHPSDFGTSAASVVVVSFLVQMSQLGLAPTLIQTPNLTARTIAVTRTLTLSIGCLVLVMTQIFAGLIGSWFRDPEVTGAIRVASIACLAYALNVTPHAILARQLKARDLGVIEVVCGVIGVGMVAIPLALLGYGYWALIIGGLAAAFSKSIILLIRVKMPPMALFTLAEAKALCSRGAGFSLTVLLQKISTESDRLIVGRYLPPWALGLYSRANGLMGMPAIFYGGLVDRVAFPAFSRVQTEPERLRDAYAQALALTALMGLPLTVFLVFTGADVIRLVLGPRWEGAIAPFQILCVALFFRMSDRVSGPLLRGVGKPYLMASVQALTCVAMIASCWVGVRHGLPGVATAVAGVAVLSYLLLTTTALKVSKLGLLPFIRGHGPGVAMAILVTAVFWPVTWLDSRWDLPPFAFLAVSGLAAGLACLAAGLFAPRVFLGTAGRGALASGLALWAPGPGRK